MSKHIELGKVAVYRDTYDASLLEAIPRQLTRAALTQVCDTGCDIWHAFELSWLRPSGVPRVAVGEFRFSAKSRCIAESKSFKYYLNSFNQSVFDSDVAVQETLVRDLSALTEGEVSVVLQELDGAEELVGKPTGQCVDGCDIQVNTYQPNVALLISSPELPQDEVCMYSHLLKSNCPVTGQPDWATVWLQYSGTHIPEPALLAYIVSFRQYQGFHESCVERIFNDVMSAYAPTSLCVYARYTRRGGLDINPIRMTDDLADMPLPFGRLLRQ